MRPLGIGRKNWLFAGFDKGGERIANVLTIIETVKLHGHNPEVHLIRLLTRIQDHPNDRLKELLPRRWAPAKDPLMARSKTIYTLEEVTANSANIAEGELVHVSDGSEHGTRGLTVDGVEGLQVLLVGIRAWDGGIREFIIDEQYDPDMIERILTDELYHEL